jgi:hypothetical protein
MPVYPASQVKREKLEWTACLESADKMDCLVPQDRLVWQVFPD